jgi:Thioesterase superfamily
MPTLIRNRFNISNPAFSRSRQELLHLSLEPPRWLFLPRQGFGSFDIPILILTVKRPAPRDGSAYIAKSAPETAKWNQVFPYVLFARTRPYCGEPAYCLAGDRGAGRRRGDGRRVGWAEVLTRCAVTTSMSMQFLAPTRATDLIAIGRVLRRGKTLVNCDVNVVTADGEAVAKAIETYKVG